MRAIIAISTALFFALPTKVEAFKLFQSKGAGTTLDPLEVTPKMGIKTMYWATCKVSWHLGLGVGGTPREIHNAITKALEDWSVAQSAKLHLYLLPKSNPKTHHDPLDKLNTLYWVTKYSPYNSTYLDRDTVALTFFEVAQDQRLLDVDIAFNARDYSWNVTGEFSYDRGKFDIEHVVMHEIGHAIGIAHSDKPGAVMTPTYYSRNLSTDDVAAKAWVYPKSRNCTDISSM